MTKNLTSKEVELILRNSAIGQIMLYDTIEMPVVHYYKNDKDELRFITLWRHNWV